MSNFKKNNKLMSIMLLFIMLVQIGFTSSSFASEVNNHYNNFNSEKNNYTIDLDRLSKSKIFNEFEKEEKILFMEMLQDEEIKELERELSNLAMSKNPSTDERNAKMSWRQTDDLLLGLWDGVYDELKGNFDSIRDIFNIDTYKAMMQFCRAILRGDIKWRDVKKAVEGELEPIEYVFDNTIEVFDPNSDVSDKEVREYGKNLCKTFIMIMDAKSFLKDLPGYMKNFTAFMGDFKDKVQDVKKKVRRNHGKLKEKKIDSKVDSDYVRRRVTSKDHIKMNLKLFSRDTRRAFEKISGIIDDEMSDCADELKRYFNRNAIKVNGSRKKIKIDEIGCRGSTVSGVRFKSKKPFDPDDFDVDAFIVSDDLAKLVESNRGFRDGRRIPELLDMSDRMEDFFKHEFDGYRTSRYKKFTFRIFSKNEYLKIVYGTDNYKLY
ncbi:MAG: hypothetical protein N4A54_07500 [Peptostreptococcaceae bacterium]|jgi:Sec-independent protein translocase protein TatA|nr:hypothetical protein [Peptostreptococcaceae bacterium]